MLNCMFCGARTCVVNRGLEVINYPDGGFCLAGLLMVSCLTCREKRPRTRAPIIGWDLAQKPDADGKMRFVTFADPGKITVTVYRGVD